MSSRLGIDITPNTIRVMIEPEGILLEDDAVLAIQLDAKSRAGRVLAVGQEATAIPETLPGLLASGELVESPTPRLVRLETAVWWQERRELLGWGRPPPKPKSDLSSYANQ